MVLLFILDENGRIQDPRVESSSRPEFEQPALKAVTRWRFQAGNKRGSARQDVCSPANTIQTQSIVALFKMISAKYLLSFIIIGTGLNLGAEPVFDPAISESFWSSPEFQKRFMASYGVNSAIEPRFENPEEQIFFSQLGEVIREDPQKAIKQISSKITSTSSAILSYTLGFIALPGRK